jgi:hypothetical protein
MSSGFKKLPMKKKKRKIKKIVYKSEGNYSSEEHHESP